MTSTVLNREFGIHLLHPVLLRKGASVEVVHFGHGAESDQTDDDIDSVVKRRDVDEAEELAQKSTEELHEAEEESEGSVDELSVVIGRKLHHKKAISEISFNLQVH